MKSLKDIEKEALSCKTKTIVLVGAHDRYALEAIIQVKNKGLINCILVGPKDKIIEELKELNEDANKYEIIDEEVDERMASLATQLIRDNKADIPMKGLISTSTLLKAILNKETGITPRGNLLFQVGVFEYDNRLIVFGDCAIIINPDIQNKIKIIENTKPLMNILHITNPKVACLSAVEKVSPKIISTVEAEELSKVNIEGFSVEGPIALDGALSIESAKHKGIESEVAGKADLLLMPNLETGNILYKSLTYIANKNIASIVLGAQTPIILTSRSDSTLNKYYSILLALLLKENPS